MEGIFFASEFVAPYFFGKPLKTTFPWPSRGVGWLNQPGNLQEVIELKQMAKEEEEERERIRLEKLKQDWPDLMGFRFREDWGKLKQTLGKT